MPIYCMKRILDEGTVRSIFQTLQERFGEPLGGMETTDGQGVGSAGGRKKDMGNRGFGAKLSEGPVVCEECGGMMPLEGYTCENCGMMAETEVSGRHPGHGTNCHCPDCQRPPETAAQKVAGLDEIGMDQVAPPGREKQVKALKKDKSIDNPWAVAWASYNKRK